jgi:long-subunit acyl-CoA synthetase (AMP-forming)
MGDSKSAKIDIISDYPAEWVVADTNIATLGEIDAPLHPTLATLQIAHIPNDADVMIVIVSDPPQLGRVLKIRSGVRDPLQIILMNEKAGSEGENTITFTEVMDAGELFEKSNQPFFQA